MYLIIILIVLIFFILNKMACGKCKSKVCLVGKTAIVTGGNSGIGYHTALDLASRGCKVIIADKDDAIASKNRIIKTTHNPNIVTKHLDLASFESVRQFTSDILATEDRLDILINNAGIGTTSSVFTEDGIQATMQVNYFAPFLLTTLLIDLLKKSPSSRIVFVSSFLAFIDNLTINNLNPSRDYKDETFFGLEFYANSKLCTIIAANGFAKKLGNSGITCNSLHPGSVYTNIYKRGFQIDRNLTHLIFVLIALCLGKNHEEGAQTTLHLAVDDQVKNTTGSYFIDCKKFYLPSKAKDEEFCKQIWELSEKYVKLEEHEKI